jgi:hypothetical protein
VTAGNQNSAKLPYLEDWQLSSASARKHAKKATKLGNLSNLAWNYKQLAIKDKEPASTFGREINRIGPACTLTDKLSCQTQTRQRE